MPKKFRLPKSVKFVRSGHVASEPSVSDPDGEDCSTECDLFCFAGSFHSRGTYQSGQSASFMGRTVTIAHRQIR